MKIVIDIECNRLNNPDKVWVIVCKDIDTNKLHIFRRVSDDLEQAEAFKEFSRGVSQWIGHNILGYDLPVLLDHNLLTAIPIDKTVDTLVLSKLVNYSRVGGHSIEQYGIEFGLEKIDIGKSIAGHNPFFNQYSTEMEEYCVRDVEIGHKTFDLYRGVLANPSWDQSISLEQHFQLITNDLHNNGFAFDVPGATKLREEVTQELEKLDKVILEAFPPKEVLIREFIPKATKFGTISKTSVPRQLHERIHEFEVGQTYRHTKLEPFNPSSHKQLIEVLTEAKWKPEERTKTHIDAERELNQLKRLRRSDPEVDLRIKELDNKLLKLRMTGWSVNEINLGTLPETAPAPAKQLAKRILLESRRRTLTEWLGLVRADGRIHGNFYAIGAWTNRMAHQQPNTANIPREFKEDGTLKLLGKEMRSLWVAPENRLLVGVDAEGIQLRIFAHYINDLEFTDALIRGKKTEKTDPHSLNQRILGSACKTRQAAKRFVYALLLGAGLHKLAEILGCSSAQAKEALDRLLERYTGFATLKREVIPEDARRGGFVGVDGRFVPIPGKTQRDREHLCMSGYLQNGEAIIIKRAACLTNDALKEEKDLKRWGFVDIVHDELQSECLKDMKLALRVAEIKAKAIEEAGKIYKLKCPMAGSYWSDDRDNYTIGENWYVTH